MCRFLNKREKKMSVYEVDKIDLGLFINLSVSLKCSASVDMSCH